MATHIDKNTHLGSKTFRKKYPKANISLFLPFEALWSPLVARNGTNPAGTPFCLPAHMFACSHRYPFRFLKFIIHKLSEKFS